MVSPNKILVENKSILTVLVDGKMDTIPNTVYNKLKVGTYAGNRIFHTFDKEKNIKVEETFDNGIFNCYVGEEPSIQLRNGEIVAKAIIQHQEDDKLDLIKKAYLGEMEQSYSEKAVNEFLEPMMKSGRVKRIGLGYLIDKRFVMTDHAVCQQYKDDTWQNVCIVVQNDINPFNIDTPFGATEVSAKAVEILSKIIFLLKPNTGDSVFMDQLVPKLREELSRDFPPPPAICVRESDWQRDEEGFLTTCTGQLDTIDALTGLKVCNVCRKASDVDFKKWEKEQAKLEAIGSDKDNTMLDNFITDMTLGSGLDNEKENDSTDDSDSWKNWIRITKHSK